jgi:hypothetical protein
MSRIFDDYTNKCAYCGEEFTADNPCWNDESYHGDLHLDGECKLCASKGKRNADLWDGKTSGGGVYERSE